MKNGKIKSFLLAIYEKLYEFRRLSVLRTKYRLRIMSPDKTIAYIKKHKCSISRYGDGEFNHILDIKDGTFQPRHSELTDELKKVMASNNKKLLVCVPLCMNTVKECNDHSKEFWIEWGKKNEHHKKIVSVIRDLAGRNYIFGDAQITRPYIDWKTDRRARRTFPKLKSLWEKRDVIIVEGEQTRLGIGNDLFDETKSIKRILAPAIDAFSKYNEIKKAIIENYNGELILLALGHTATVLAADLAEQGMQALDIGHIDVEYMWYLMGAKTRVPIPGKFTNEAKEGRTFSECSDEKYLSQIVARVGC